MKIVAISDTHGSHHDVKLPHGDVLIHAGDFCSAGGMADAVGFLNWFNSQPHPTKIFIAGNHDIIFERDPGLMKSVLKGYPELIYLEDTNVVIDGIKFHGSPVTPRFFNWAFNRDRGEEIKRHWDMIPDDIDVLITHGPPYKFCDEAYRHDYRLTERVGCKDLLEATLRVAPKLHVFGHIHYSGGRFYTAPKTTYANVSLMDESYGIAQRPQVFELEDGIVSISS